jgi:ABC-type dipeptide/oligopeptide/nickel transport system permease component
MTYFGKRLTVAILTVFVAASLNFALFRLAPGNPAQSMARVPGASQALRRSLERQFGVDKPLVQQYGLYLKGLVTGHLGVSFQDRQPVASDLVKQLAATIPMVLLGTVFAIVIGCSIGVLAAVRRGSASDHVGVGAGMVMYSLPTQWVGLMLIGLLGGWLPVMGMQNYFQADTSLIARGLDVGSHMILPALTFGLSLFGEFVIVMRSSMLETLGEDYVLTAKAKGLSTWGIVRAHALRNALIPTLQLIAISVGYVVGGAILVEVVFSWPGIGSATYQAVSARDYPMLQGQFLVLAVAVVVCNLIADLLIYRLDPRVRS